MIIPNSINLAYSNLFNLLVEVKNRVSETLQKYCEENGFLLESRIKSLESLTEKIEMGRFSHWGNLDDLYACTIIIPLITEEEKVLKFLRETFLIGNMTKRGQNQKPPDVFRFDNTRCSGKLKPIPNIDQIDGTIYSIGFEIQIKSVLDYAWSKTMHALTYKSEQISWARLRLSSQLKATVEQMEMLVIGFESVATEELLDKGNSPDIDDKIKIRGYFTRLIEQNRLPNEVIPKDWSRFSDNIYRFIQLLEPKSDIQHKGKLKKLTQVLEILTTKLSHNKKSLFPMSISLFQWVVATIVEERHTIYADDSEEEFFNRFKGYYVFVTQELLTLYPDTNSFPDKFTYLK